MKSHFAVSYMTHLITYIYYIIQNPCVNERKKLKLSDTVLDNEKNKSLRLVMDFEYYVVNMY